MSQIYMWFFISEQVNYTENGALMKKTQFNTRIHITTKKEKLLLSPSNQNITFLFGEWTTMEFSWKIWQNKSPKKKLQSLLKGWKMVCTTYSWMKQWSLSMWSKQKSGKMKVNCLKNNKTDWFIFLQFKTTTSKLVSLHLLLRRKAHWLKSQLRLLTMWKRIRTSEHIC